MKHRDLDKAHREKRRTWSRLRQKKDDPGTTKQYTPQDLQALSGDALKENGAGVLRPNTSNLRMPANLEDIGEASQTNHPNRVLLIIVTLALIFIAIIAYLVSRMPAKV